MRSRSDLTARERAALNLLAGWDGRAYAPGATGGSSPMSTAPESSTDGPAATLFTQITRDIKKALFGSLSGADKARLDTLSTESHQYDATPMDNLAMRVLRPGLSGLGAPTLVAGTRSASGVVRHALDDAIQQLSTTYGQSQKSWRRPHGISHIESLTGVIGPSTTMPFEDRGTWVQQVAFTTGRPFPARQTSAGDQAGGGGSLAATGSSALLPSIGLVALVAGCVAFGVRRRTTPALSRRR